MVLKTTKASIFLRFCVFVILNFLALGIGGYFTGLGMETNWYAGLNKAPWTPPGWVFGAAWTTIMLCYSVYMAVLWPKVAKQKSLSLQYALQWVLNVVWTPIFFLYHHAAIGLVCISALSVLILYFTVNYRTIMAWQTLWLMPYLLWITLATSLNAYIYFYN